jgi:hypothetical protein
MRHVIIAAIVVGLTGGPAAARPLPAQGTGSDVDHPQQSSQTPMAGAHAHGPSVPALTYAELQQTTEQLAAARAATAKYQDARTAEADGYRAIGPNVPGMGIHYVRRETPRGFSIAEPPILLYEKDPTTADLRLVGVSYLLVAPAGADGQPATSPFPKTLATWHKHNNVCVLPDSSASVELTEAQCTERGGRFTAETSWMVHAWIWKDSPSGVFSSTNPLVK